MKLSKIFLSIVFIGWVVPAYITVDGVFAKLNQIAMPNSSFISPFALEEFFCKVALFWLTVSLFALFWKN